MAANDDNSVALPVVRAAGDPFQRGRALGAHARAAIHAAVCRTAGFQALLPWRGTAVLRALEAAARARFPAYVAELEGLAAGAEWSFEEAFLWNCRGDLRALAETRVIGCTTLFDATPADYLIAHNEDGAPEFAGLGFMVDWQPSDGLAAWSFAYPGMLLGHSFAVNAKGLVQTINNIRANDARPGVPRQFVTRAILDCGDLDQALDVIVEGPRASGFHHGLGQAGDPRLFSVEAPASDFAVTRVQRRYAHANHLIDPRLKKVPQTITHSSASRQTHARTRFVDEGAAALDVLFDATGELPIHCRGRVGEDSYTLATALFRITDLGVHLDVVGDDPAAPTFRASIRP
jgi:hypothetical protein